MHEPSNTPALWNDMTPYNDAELDQSIRSFLQSSSQPSIPNPILITPTSTWLSVSSHFESFSSPDHMSTGTDTSQLVSFSSSQEDILVNHLMEMDGNSGDSRLAFSSPLTTPTSPDLLDPKREEEGQVDLSIHHYQLPGNLSSNASHPPVLSDFSTSSLLSNQERKKLSHLSSPPLPIAGCKRQLSALDSSRSSLPMELSSPPEMISHTDSSWLIEAENSFKQYVGLLHPEGALENDQCDWSEIVLANSHDMVFVLSLKGTVLYMSPSVFKILGFVQEEIVGRPLIDFCHPADVGPLNRELKESAKQWPSTNTSNAPAQGTNANENTSKAQPRVDVIMRMMIKSGGYALIEATGSLVFEPPKHRKVLVCSGRPHPIPMLPWEHVRGDLLNPEPSGWLKVSHNGIFLGSTGPVHQILGIKDVNLIGRHLRDLPMVMSSSDLLEALELGHSVSVQDYIQVANEQKASVKLTVYPWTSTGRSHTVAFVHVQRQSNQQIRNNDRTLAAKNTRPHVSNFTTESPSCASPNPEGAGAGLLTGMKIMPNGGTRRIMSKIDADSTVFCELTGFHNGSWLIEMQKLQNTNKRLRHELLALSRRGSDSNATILKPLMTL